jgi:hypothetical protein
MANLTSVGITAGVPTSGTGTVSTIDGAFQTANGPISIKPASTAPIATDPAAVVSLSPNSVGLVTTGTAGSASTQVISVQGIASMTPIITNNQAAITGGFSYSNITTDTTTVVKTGAGTLHSVVLNNPVATEVITIYDNTSAVAPKIGTITVPTSPQPVTLIYDVAFTTGLTVVTATAVSDITVCYK